MLMGIDRQESEDEGVKRATLVRGNFGLPGRRGFGKG
jgi:hypothetical protein